MKKKGFHHFDANGFLFFLKFTSAVVMLVLVFQYGSYAVMGKVFPQTPAEARAVEKQKRIEARIKSAELQAEDFSNEREKEEEFLKTRTVEGQTLETVIPENGRFVGVDLVNMKVLLYEDGDITKTLPVVSKGRPGSHWETPSGVYEFKTKERTHFSSIGDVYMPYSMQFFGNFFIHGWPYYSGGKPVEEGYSGGCIRLSSEDAQEVYDFVNVGTGLFVYEDKGTEEKTYAKVRSGEAPDANARAYMVADIDTGQVFAEKNAEKELPIASITKLMTALVANETISFDSRVPIVDSGVYVPPDVSKIDEGLLVGELLYPLLLESNNRVAQSIATYYGKNLFLKRMNEKADAFGMGSTEYADASGLSSGNISTAKDLFYMMQYINNQKSFILNMTREDSRSVISNSDKEYVFHNKTHFLDRDDYLGGKIGYTPEAGETMASLFKISVGEQTHTVAVIVLGAEERDKAVLKLLDWLQGAVVSSEDS